MNSFELLEWLRALPEEELKKTKVFFESQKSAKQEFELNVTEATSGSIALYTLSTNERS